MKKITDYKIILSDYPDYLCDESRVTAKNADCILWPENEYDIIQAVAVAHSKNIPITVSAARTGIVAAAVPLNVVE